jgi:hypothetical protein
MARPVGRREKTSVSPFDGVLIVAMDMSQKTTGIYL